MVTPDLLFSWSRTEQYLLQAKGLITPTPATTGALDEVAEYLEHNELGRTKSLQLVRLGYANGRLSRI